MKKFILPDKIYNALKWTLLVFVPALIVLIIGLGKLYGFDTELIVGTISLIATFVGSLIGLSNFNYLSKSDDKK